MKTAATFVALPISALVIWTLLRTGLARRVLALPTGERWHTSATPTLGGVGIFAGIVAGIGAAWAVGAIELRPALAGIVAGCAILFLAGLVDDVWALKPVAKLGAQFAAAGCVLAGGLTVEVIEAPLLAGAVAVIWLVGVTNAFNLLDNMDGLAATLAAIACFYFALDAYFVNENVTALVVAITVGLACVGFLPFNVRPGKPAAIFMGDSGSQVLGFVLASLALYTSYEVAGATLATLVVPLLILAVPIMDTVLVTVVRLLEGRPVSQGGRDHSSHRLVYQGLSEKRALALLAVLAAGLGGSGLAYHVFDRGRITMLGILITFAALVQFASFLGDVERRGSPPPEHGPWLLRSLVVHRRRLVEVVVDGALVSAAFLGAYLLVVGDTGTENQRTVFMAALPVLLFARYAAFVVFGLYRGLWRYAGARDAVGIVLAVVTASVAAFVYLDLVHALGDFPRSIFVIDALICALLVGGSRFAERAIDASLGSMQRRGDRRRTLIVGAGRSGRSLLRELRETRGEQVVGFVDDDPGLRRRRLQGVTVLGRTDELPLILPSVRPDAVLVTIPDADPLRLGEIVAACAAADVPCRFVRRQLDLDPETVLSTALK